MTDDTTVIDRISGLRVHPWKSDDGGASICIRRGTFFLNIPLQHARALVDAVHDTADSLERLQREGNAT